ncbi:MAG: TM0106 family RecB-like putative nuclease [Gemmatimonadaceae bacterium]
MVNFLGCSHSTALDIHQLGESWATTESDPYIELLKEKGLEHERTYLETLRASGRQISEIASSGLLNERVVLTRDAMAAGVEVIYQGALFGPPWHGYSDFLVRRDGVTSKFGNYAYEVVDTKLSLSAKPKHVVQLAIYSQLVANEQDAPPPKMHVVLGNGTRVSLPVSDFAHYCDIARGRFESFVGLAERETIAEPCGHCALCRWADQCTNEWDKAAHLSLVAGITRSHILKLRAEGITSLDQLASLSTDRKIQKLQIETLARIRAQASLQAKRRAGGEPEVEILPLTPAKGFARLPQSNPGDLFFDMEGDPLFTGGLEYLFGFDHVDKGKVGFTSFWAHDRAAEKKAFQNAVDFISARLAAYPDAHVYHYAHYEEGALKRLAMLHATREAEIDDLLRESKLVDLFKVVREGIRISEPAYSLKNLEVFYSEARPEAVKNAGESIVVYERWRKLRDDQLLQEISDYNEFDCRSTRMCRDWLLQLRPIEAEWFDPSAVPLTAKAEAASEDRRVAEEQMDILQASLLDGVAEEDLPWRELLGDLLEFHHREAKPSWWKMFDRIEMSVEELIDDAECIGGLTADPTNPPYTLKKSIVYSFRFLPQDLKMRVGESPLRAVTGESAGEIVALNEDAGTIALKLGPSKSRFEEPLSLVPDGPLNDKPLRSSVYRYSTAVAEGKQDAYAAVTGVLRKTLPRLKGLAAGGPIIPPGKDLLNGSVDAICAMRETHMLIQGPPGSGKTYTSSHAIVELLDRKKRVAVSSNSHKAINNLLLEVETIAAKRGVKFKGAKKSSNEDQFLKSGGCIIDTCDAKVATDPEMMLVAGTAWLFAKEELDQQFHYMFVDEAGQVSLANVIVLGLAAHNLVLVGDQMQLSQPMQGAHPGGSGMSALDHLLGEQATVPPEAGIFLAKTWRLHPDICRFISSAVYDGRLEPADGNENQVLVLTPGLDPAMIAPSGIRFVDVAHSGCAQRSDEEATAIQATYQSLLAQKWKDSKGVVRDMRVDDILVLAPFNMQVNLLKTVLPRGARVGTVDKIQGQAAAVVLISMTTSSGDDSPRNIDFLYSRNRLNVAISRARTLAVVFANPQLLAVSCKTIEQMKLVNTLCWVKNYAADQLALVQQRSMSAPSDILCGPL